MNVTYFVYVRIAHIGLYGHHGLDAQRLVVANPSGHEVDSVSVVLEETRDVLVQCLK